MINMDRIHRDPTELFQYLLGLNYIHHVLCTKLGYGEVKVTYLISCDGCCRSVAAGAVGASLGGVPGQNSGNVPNGGASRNHHVHSSTCSHHHQGNSQIGSIPLGLGTLGLSRSSGHDGQHTA